MYIPCKQAEDSSLNQFQAKSVPEHSDPNLFPLLKYLCDLELIQTQTTILMQSVVPLVPEQ
jgi:hypothetical protein